VHSWKRCAPEAQLRLFVSTQFTRQSAARCGPRTEFSHSLGQEENAGNEIARIGHRCASGHGCQSVVVVFGLHGNPASEANTWVNDYVASYRYRYTWFLLFFPVFGLLAICLVWRSGAAVAVASGAELLFTLIFFEYKMYCIELGVGTIRIVSMLRTKSFSLAEVELIQHLYGEHGGQLLLIRHSNRILLTASQALDGFDDLVGFFREYARHRHLIFATRDNWGDWMQGWWADGGGLAAGIMALCRAGSRGL
jgi:hypothetical protein